MIKSRPFQSKCLCRMERSIRIGTYSMLYSVPHAQTDRIIRCLCTLKYSRMCQAWQVFWRREMHPLHRPTNEFHLLGIYCLGNLTERKAEYDINYCFYPSRFIRPPSSLNTTSIEYRGPIQVSIKTPRTVIDRMCYLEIAIWRVSCMMRWTPGTASTKETRSSLI